MYDLVKHLWQIDGERLDQALASLTRNAAHEQKRLQHLHTLRKSDLVGRVINRSCLPVFESLFPGYTVRFSISEYSDKRWRYLYVTDNATREHWGFTLADKENTRMTVETLEQDIERTRKDYAEYSSMAAELPAQVTAYNAAAAYLKPIASSIQSAYYRAQDRIY